MSDDIFQSSDSVRSAAPLKHAQTFEIDGPVELAAGGRLESVSVTYETYGRLNEDRSNAVLICHALSGDSHVASHDGNDDPGWWDLAVGSGKPIDTEKYFVICPNILGGCRGTTGPNSINPATGKPYGAEFPVVTIGDMVNVERRLIDHLGIERLLCVIGGSMGGHQVLDWAVRYGERVGGAIAIATSARLTSQALAFDVVARNAIMRDPNFCGGQYYDSGKGPDVGLAIARMLGHVTYLSREAMKAKFGADRLRPQDVPTDPEKIFSVGSYLAYQGSKFVERFDANSYLTLSRAMDLFDLGADKEQLAEKLGASRCRWLVMSFTSDWLFPPDQSREIVEALLARDRPVSYSNIDTPCGHDAFLLPDDLDAWGGLIGAFMANLNGDGAPRPPQHIERAALDPTSIFHPDHPRRLDYDRILELIAPGASMLDLGCGAGGLLEQLRRHGCGRLLGIELNEESIIACVRKGLDVMQADLNEGLGAFADKQFDYVGLSQTLQAVHDVERIVADMLRVGRKCIVSFPNLAYHGHRKTLAEQGRAPETSGLAGATWYNTPNIRFFSIADFEEFCRRRDITIHRRIALDTDAWKEISDEPNLNADLAIFVISR